MCLSKNDGARKLTEDIAEAFLSSPRFTLSCIDS